MTLLYIRTLHNQFDPSYSVCRLLCVMQRPTTMGRHDARAATGAELIAPTMPLSCAPSLAASSSCQLDNTNNTDTQGNVCRYANDTVYHHRRHPSTGSPREVRGAMDHTSAAHRPCVEQAAALPQPPAVEALQVIDRLRWWRLQRVSEQPLPPITTSFPITTPTTPPLVRAPCHLD